MKILKRIMNDKSKRFYGVSITGNPVWGVGYGETYINGVLSSHILPREGAKPVEVKPKSIVFLR